ncbi:esterase-like activity of phytase family protein [Azospirillum sp. TSO22-1]|uniref:esterase-like activity of phytase family protein n=1 Tax=Azospirillum sp. TSO22-1 TaxID=716789 RepID=UPI001304AD4E|nr:esterase-like activity of phytase family protein [Azospirillum sp. TSO22-1]
MIRIPSLLPRRRAAALLIGMLAAGACADPSGGAERRAASHPMPLTREAPEPERIGAFEFRGAVELSGDPAVGGLSGLAITDGGRQFVAVEDVGRVVLGRLRHENGRLVGVADLRVKGLPGIGPRHGRARENDSEEIVALPDGGWLISFEGRHRILRYPPGFDGEPTPLPLAVGMADLPLNGGMEALTRLPDGRLLALAEGPDDGVPERRAWISRVPLKGAGDWGALTYRAAPGFRPTGATALPNGDVLVLERYFSMLGGLAARIARVPGTALVPGAVVEGEELARIQPPLLLDNYEGIAAVPGPAGETLVYVVSDDNFNTTLQRTYLLLLALPDRPLAQAPGR